MGWTILGSKPARSKEISLISKTSIPALELTQSPIQWVLEILSPAVKHSGSDVGHPPYMPTWGVKSQL